MKAVGALTVSVGLATGAAVMAAPAQADLVSDQFLSALNNSGVGYNDPGTAVNMAQSICPLLAQPGGNVASAASQMTGNNGISPDMAGLFTSIAISMYCPNMMASFANGNWLNNGDFLGQSGIPGIPGLPGIPGF
ncbi:MAG TPA: DUF732 domain-containing protein [Mycobacterium sp.]|jgi:hypothetical protein|nr:DUF732 domain-containing protein [Mycobacterium sp.]